MLVLSAQAPAVHSWAEALRPACTPAEPCSRRLCKPSIQVKQVAARSGLSGLRLVDVLGSNFQHLAHDAHAQVQQHPCSSMCALTWAGSMLMLHLLSILFTGVLATSCSTMTTTAGNTSKHTNQQRAQTRQKRSGVAGLSLVHVPGREIQSHALHARVQLSDAACTAVRGGSTPAVAACPSSDCCFTLFTGVLTASCSTATNQPGVHASTPTRSSACTHRMRLGVACLRLVHVLG